MLERLHAGDFDFARGAPVVMPTRDGTAREGQIVRPLFVGKAEVHARATPLGAVRRDPSPACAFVCEQVREFVTQRPVDLVVAECAQAWIQSHQCATGKSDAGGAAHAGIPLDADALPECRGARSVQQRAGFREQRVVRRRADLQRKRDRLWCAWCGPVGFDEEAFEKIELHRVCRELRVGDE